jgi:putative FmdB family regulatory protein
MPTYEFRCPKGHEFERFYKTMSTAPSELQCPECGAVAARQLSGGGGLVFKGSGFYLTDYGKNAHRGGKMAESKSDGGKSDAGSSESKSESKSEAKSDAKSESTSSAKAESKSESAKPKAGPEPKAPSSKNPTSE